MPSFAHGKSDFSHLHSFHVSIEKHNCTPKVLSTANSYLPSSSRKSFLGFLEPNAIELLVLLVKVDPHNAPTKELGPEIMRMQRLHTTFLYQVDPQSTAAHAYRWRMLPSVPIHRLAEIFDTVSCLNNGD